jgi:hypothetical protein
LEVHLIFKSEAQFTNLAAPKLTTDAQSKASSEPNCGNINKSSRRNKQTTLEANTATWKDMTTQNLRAIE